MPEPDYDLSRNSRERQVSRRYLELRNKGTPERVLLMRVMCFSLRFSDH